MPTELDTLCVCGKDKNTTHCPQCGRINFYALKTTITRPHPISGEIVDNVTMFRCRTCGCHFDNLQWQFDCKAPVSSKLEQARQREDNRQTLIHNAITGVRFTENDKRHFRKIVGMEYDMYVSLHKRAQQQKTAAENAEQAAHKLLHSKPKGMPVLKERKLTPLQYHIENCNYCMTGDELCAVGKNLQIAERMEQP